jgi:hypothetical protein
MLDFLSGKKTYSVALGLCLMALGSYFHGDYTLLQAVEEALTGLGLATLRAGVAKVGAVSVSKPPELKP